MISNPIGAFLLIRWLMGLTEQTEPLPKPVSSFERPLLGLPCAGIYPPPPHHAAPSPLIHLAAVSPPVVVWTEDQELLAWRAWRLAAFMSRSPDEESGPRLLSLSASRIWSSAAADPLELAMVKSRCLSMYSINARPASSSSIMDGKIIEANGPFQEWVAYSPPSRLSHDPNTSPADAGGLRL